MTATDGAPVLQGGGTATTAGAGRETGVSAPRQPPRLRVVLGIARAEASLLVRSVLVLAGTLAGGAVVWIFIYPVQPVWWSVTWEIGGGQLILAATVLVAAQLAAGRASRDGMADLYASFPVAASTRTAGQLAGLAGAAPASLLLMGATAVAVQLLGAVGVPSVTVLAGGLLMVIASGAAGIAIGTRFAHPLAGLLGALVLLGVSAEGYKFSSAAIWLLPWEFKQDDLQFLPAPLAGYPPAGAHAMELAAIAILAAILALAVAASAARARGALAAGGILAAAVIVLAGVVQLRPIPTANLNYLVAETANPASVQHCTTSNKVRYCLYPGFGSLLPSLEAPVNAVLARVPARPDRHLAVSQAGTPSLDPTLTHGQPRQQMDRWNEEMQQAPDFASPASAIYLPIGEWPAFGGRLADARFNVALATAEWAVHIPLTANTGPACVPLDQAREAIAIWLAILATHPPAAELQAGLPKGVMGVRVDHTFVPTWTYPGLSNGQVDQVNGTPPQTTEAGYLLATAMTNLPEQKVARILRDGWSTWVSARTTDAQLAAALGIRMNSAGVAQPPMGQGPVPINPVCGS